MSTVFHVLEEPEMDALLSGVSRSLYLPLVVMPRPVRGPLAVGYLLARIGDTLVDTEVVRREQRWPLLLGLQEEIDARASGSEGSDAFVRQVNTSLRAALGLRPAERLLLDQVEVCLRLFQRLAPEDRERVQRALTDSINGMANDVRRFNGHTLVALETFEELDQHCHLGAGSFMQCFAELTAAHVPGMAELASPRWLARAVSAGKVLQLVNILRDAPRDLLAGRCYLPRELLDLHGLRPPELCNPFRRRRGLPVLHALCELTLRYLDEAWAYVMALPKTVPRLRLAHVWMQWMCLMTLERILALSDPLDPARTQKVPRRAVYRMMAESVAVVAFDSLLERMHQRRRERVVHWLRLKACPATGAEPPRILRLEPREEPPAASP